METLGELGRLSNYFPRRNSITTPLLYHLEVASDEAFWTLLTHDGPGRETEWGRIFVVLQAIWLQHDEQIFKGG